MLAIDNSVITQIHDSENEGPSRADIWGFGHRALGLLWATARPLLSVNWLPEMPLKVPSLSSWVTGLWPWPCQPTQRRNASLVWGWALESQPWAWLTLPGKSCSLSTAVLSWWDAQAWNRVRMKLMRRQGIRERARDSYGRELEPLHLPMPEEVSGPLRDCFTSFSWVSLSFSVQRIMSSTTIWQYVFLQLYGGKINEATHIESDICIYQ